MQLRQLPPPRVHPLGLNLNKRCYLDVFVETVATVESFVNEFDDEVGVNLLRVELLNEVACSLHGSACGEEVVVQQNNVVFTDSILVNLDGVLAILLSVAFLYCVAGQFARLAAEHNASAETQGEQTT